MKKVVIVDSGSANLNSIQKALHKASLPAIVTGSAAAIEDAAGVVFPGVGAFEHAMIRLREKALNNTLKSVISNGMPFLGICLGMQLLFSESEESPLPGLPAAGLNAIPGSVKLFPPGLTVPHVGWNFVVPQFKHPLFSGLEEGAYFYFTHSYYVLPAERSHTLAVTEYGLQFASAAAKANLMGVQFHPEKSGTAGLHLLNNFGKIIADPAILNL